MKEINTNKVLEVEDEDDDHEEGIKANIEGMDMIEDIKKDEESEGSENN